MNINRKGSALALAALVVGALGAGAGYKLRAQPSNYKAGRVPVTVVYETEGQSVKLIETQYYRSDGSMAKSVVMPENDAHPEQPQFEVFDLGKKLNFLKDTLTQKYDQFPLVQRRYDQLGHSPLSCEAAITAKNEKCEPMGNETVLGYRVQRLTLTGIEKRPGLKITSFIAPDLDYIELAMERSVDGVVKGTRTATKVVLGEPDAAVFELPSSYVKVDNSSDFVTAGEIARGRQNALGDNASRVEFDARMDQSKKDGAAIAAK